jgi:carbonic anhydrase
MIIKAHLCIRKTDAHPSVKQSKLKRDKKMTTKNYLFTILMLTCLSAAHAQKKSQTTHAQALQWLKEGNQRFVEGKTSKPRQDFNRLKEVAKEQNPFATVVGCSDSRVPNEIIFDQGLGDLFIVRTAGQVSTFASWGSIEFAEEILGTKLIVVLGHTKCGAVNAAVNLPEVPGHIVTLINAIKPAVEKAKEKNTDHLLDESIRENVRMQVQQLKALEPVLAKRVREGSVIIIGAVYDLNTGLVEFFE